MTAKTIDERIRERADRSLKAEIDSALAPLEKLYNSVIGSIDLPVRNESGSNLTLGPVIQIIRQAVFETKRDKSQEKALADFLSKIDGLQDQIDEVRGSIEID